MKPRDLAHRWVDAFNLEVAPDTTLVQIGELPKLVPIGAYVTCFDQEYNSPSEYRRR